MSVAIPTVSYAFPVGGLAGRKLAKQSLIPSADNGIIYLPGGSAGQPISPSFLGSWDDTSNASRFRGYIAFSLAEKLAQGGGSVEMSMEVAPSHGGGTAQKSYLFAQHVIQIPDLFTPESAIRGVTRGAFERALSEGRLWSDSTYRGCVSAICDTGGETIFWEHVSGPFDNPPDSFITPTLKMLFKVRLLDFNGDFVETVYDTATSVTVDYVAGDTRGVALVPSSSLSNTATRPNNRKAAYLVSELGLVVSQSGNNVTRPGGGVWWASLKQSGAFLQFDDSDNGLMTAGETTMRSTYLCPFDYASVHLPDYWTQLLGVSR